MARLFAPVVPPNDPRICEPFPRSRGSGTRRLNRAWLARTIRTAFSSSRSAGWTRWNDTRSCVRIADRDRRGIKDAVEALSRRDLFGRGQVRLSLPVELTDGSVTDCPRCRGWRER